MLRCCEFTCNVTVDSVKNSVAAPTSLLALSQTEDSVEFQSQDGEESPHKAPHHMSLWLSLLWGSRKGIEVQRFFGVFTDFIKRAKDESHIKAPMHFIRTFISFFGELYQLLLQLWALRTWFCLSAL